MISAKILIFYPLPPFPLLDLIYTIKFKQPPLLHLLSMTSSPSDADIISGSSLIGNALQMGRTTTARPNRPRSVSVGAALS